MGAGLHAMRLSVLAFVARVALLQLDTRRCYTSTMDIPVIVRCGCDFDCAESMAKFMDRVTELPSGCWLWLGGRVGRPDYLYGVFSVAQRRSGRCPAHRWSVEHFHGSIADGLVVDHLCRVTLCVNPSHLQAVTPRENLLRGKSFVGGRVRDYCKYGHAFSPENTRLRRDGKRTCIECGRRRNREHYARLTSPNNY